MSPTTDLISLADLKRLLELIRADPALLERLRADPGEVARSLSLSWDPRLVRKLWDPEARQEPDDPVLSEWRRSLQDKLRYRQQVREEGLPRHPRFRAWRQRQVARLRIQLPGPQQDAVVHPPWCAELTQGCSVGCWFCGLSAQGLTAVYPYSPENARTWDEILELMSEVCGPAARWGFGYWATDPLDNPDYEKFMTAFSDRLGMFPQTTTAQAWKYPERVRELLRLSRERGCFINRFSVLTRAILEKIHKAFTPEEMEFVECVLQNRETPTPKAQAGHARDPQKRRADKTNQVREEDASTIACVTGLLLKMVEGIAELVTPCGADERWPDGYYRLRRGRFSSGEQLRTLVKDWLEALPLTVEELRPLRLSRGATCSPAEQGLRLEGRYSGLSLHHASWVPNLHALGKRLREGGGSCAQELAMLAFYQDGTPEELTLHWLQMLFEQGWLDEEPEP